MSNNSDCLSIQSIQRFKKSWRPTKINYRQGMIIDNYDYDNPANCSTETC